MSYLFDTATISLVAILVDACFGWPAGLYQRIGHPVTWLGQLITALDQRLNRGDQRVLRGVIASLVTIAAAVLPAILLTCLLLPLPGGTVLLGILAAPLVAARSLDEHVSAVARPLAQGHVHAARAAVAMIVGRDLDDRPEPIARAALESLAENTSDGVVAPVFWCLVGGLPGIAAYKAINTLDSMIGHLNARHGEFGRFAARLDDVVNLPASRLTGAFFALAAMRRQAWQVMRRDARHHRSPNAGWPEAAMAGALGVRLSGPRSYGGKITEEPWLNASAPDPVASDLSAGLRLYRHAMVLMAALLSLIWLSAA